MFRTFCRHLECLILVFSWLAAARSPHQQDHSTGFGQYACGLHNGRLENPFMAFAAPMHWATQSSSPLLPHIQNIKKGNCVPESGSTSSSFRSEVTPGSSATSRNTDDSAHPFSSLFSVSPKIPSYMALAKAISPSQVDDSISTAEPLVISPSIDTAFLSPKPVPMWLTQLTPEAGPMPSPSAPASLPLPPDENPNVTVPTAPLPSPTPGCCDGETVPRPGSSLSSCVCVYPIKLSLLVENVSTTFTNWSGVFQQNLASGLGVKTIQIQITSFQFNSSNLSLAIIIAPLDSISFPKDVSDSFRNKLIHHDVYLNNTIFGNYTLLDFQLYEPSAPSSLQAPPSEMSPAPMSKSIPTIKQDYNGYDQGMPLWLKIVISLAGIVMLFVFLFLFWKGHGHCRPKGSLHKVSDIRSMSVASIPWSITTRTFTYDELKQATNNFNPENILGQGGSGRVYKGILKDGTAVAIKRFDGRGQSDRVFEVEVEMLSRLHHRNLVKLVGCYASRDKSQHLLCYELVPNGSLDAWLHGPQGSIHPLDWETRLKIALDAARGLAYLHEDSQPCVIHRDFKASNILLESNFNAKVADFGLAKLAPEGETNYVASQVMGTFGYVAPEYALTGHLLVKSDVYSYGVVLLEILSGRKPVDMSQPPGQQNLVTWARSILRDRERLEELADPRLSNNYQMEDFAQVASIAAACVAPEVSQRPTMGEVVQSLRMMQRQSEHTSGERTISSDNILHSSVTYRTATSRVQNTQQSASAAMESDGSSVFSSGPYSGVVLDHEEYSRSAVFSEDLHEGR
ncbi:hypothetical protein KP509_12G037500 [Ceratopteris richardii]|uniref:Protein kinase domain-containing protein n=1 Tax=Ceratopteris richardii TaxID=49495 RepID=A0A8T2TKQ2_CERRI|nr:hypothetical protein KP509_12G037500 [Ceratopteris richardii]